MLQQKATVSKKAFFSAEELAKELNIKKFLVKSWEREFRVKPEHSAGGSKCYSQDNLKTFAAIKDLLLNKKMTFSQAKSLLSAREVAAPVKPAASVAEPHVVAQNLTAAVTEASVTESAIIEPTDVALEAAATVDEVQAASVSEDSMVEAVEMEMRVTAEVSVAPVQAEPVAQDDLVQPAVMPQEPETEQRVTSVQQEVFFQKIRDFKKQLLEFKEQLDLEC